MKDGPLVLQTYIIFLLLTFRLFKVLKWELTSKRSHILLFIANGYQNVLFHVKGNLSDYSLERIAEIKETVANLLKCTSEEILIGGVCPSSSFLLLLSIKDTYLCKLLALEQCDKDTLTKLDIDYIIVDLIVINLEPSKGNQLQCIHYVTY